MACSDNVVRAGLTPKYKDVDVLCSMLNYHCLPAEENHFSGRVDPAHPEVTVFDPPVPDFTVARIQVIYLYHEFMGFFCFSNIAD